MSSTVKDTARAQCNNSNGEFSSPCPLFLPYLNSNEPDFEFGLDEFACLHIKFEYLRGFFFFTNRVGTTARRSVTTQADPGDVLRVLGLVALWVDC